MFKPKYKRNVYSSSKKLVSSKSGEGNWKYSNYWFGSMSGSRSNQWSCSNNK